jgi:DNA-binding CsgD family transcriptional regulator
VTRLPTARVLEHGLPRTLIPRVLEIELQGGDFNTFDALARSRPPVASLSRATNGQLHRSERHRELWGPHGFGDELRALLVSDFTTWGALTLVRASHRQDFTPADVALVAAVSEPLADGLRRATLRGAPAEPHGEDQDPAGFVLLAPDNSVSLANAAAERWLAELREAGPAEPLPAVISAVAGRARSLAASRDAGLAAHACVRTASGQWLVVRGSTLGDSNERTAVIVGPAGPHELAPLIAAAYELSDRERAVTQLIAEGLPTSMIADRLCISPWTVQDHLKSIFEKTGVCTRGELVARLFFERHAPRLTTPVDPEDQSIAALRG